MQEAKDSKVIPMTSFSNTYMEGEELTDGLLNLVKNFDSIAVPAHGKYVKAG
jgi:hypothetical protein